MPPDNSHAAATPGRQGDDPPAEPVVLVADDDPAVVERVAAALRDRYAVRTAVTADELLASVDDAVAVVLVGPSLADRSNGRLVSRIGEACAACQVAAIATERPDDDPFDDFLAKPVSESALLDAVDRLVRRATYRSKLESYYALVSRYVDPDEPTDEADRRRLAELETDVRDVLDTLDSEDAYAAALREFDE